MDTKTGHIFIGITDEEAKQRELEEIPKEELEKVVNMNRRQRRAWAAKRRRERSGAT